MEAGLSIGPEDGEEVVAIDCLPGELDGGIAALGNEPGNRFGRRCGCGGRADCRPARFERVVTDGVEDFVADGSEVGFDGLAWGDAEEEALALEGLDADGDGVVADSRVGASELFGGPDEADGGGGELGGAAEEVVVLIEGAEGREAGGSTCGARDDSEEAKEESEDTHGLPSC